MPRFILPQPRFVLPLLFLTLFCTCVRAQVRIIFEDNFDNGAFQPEWTPRPNLQGINGVVDVNVNVGFNGSPAARIGKFQNSELTVNALNLSTSSLLRTSGVVTPPPNW